MKYSSDVKIINSTDLYDFPEKIFRLEITYYQNGQQKTNIYKSTNKDLRLQEKISNLFSWYNSLKIYSISLNETDIYNLINVDSFYVFKINGTEEIRYASSNEDGYLIINFKCYKVLNNLIPNNLQK